MNSGAPPTRSERLGGGAMGTLTESRPSGVDLAGQGDGVTLAATGLAPLQSPHPRRI